MPRQGKGYNIGPGGIPRPEKVGPFPELLGVQKRVKRVEEHKEKKIVQKRRRCEGDEVRAAEIDRVSS